VSLFPTKPEVAIRAPAALLVGTEEVIEIDVTAAEPTRIEYMEVRMRGVQGWSVGSGKHQVSVRSYVPDLVTRPLGEGVLAGTTTHVVRFVLPTTTAPTHALTPAYSQLWLRVRIAIPWWPDARYKWSLPARLPPPPSVLRQPWMTRSTDAHDKPRIELGVPSRTLVAGEVVQVSCALFHVDDRDAHTVTLSLTPKLALTKTRGRGRARERDAKGFSWKLEVPPGRVGTSVPFDLALPVVTPSFASDTHSLEWTLSASTGSFFGGRIRVEVPVEIVDAAAAAISPPARVAPRLADQRTAATFAEFASRAGWRILGEGDGGAGDAIVERETEHGTLRLGYAYREEEGSFLVATLAHRASLGLGLSVNPGSTLRHVMWADIEAGVSAWDRAHHVVARSADQTIPFLRAVVPALVAAKCPGVMRRWDDDAILFEAPAVSIELDALAAAARALAAAAAAIEAGRPQIGMPAGVSDDRAGWEALAAWLGGELVVGDLAITGQLDAAPVELAAVFAGGGPRELRVRVGAPEIASAAARKVTLSLAKPALLALDAPERLAALLVTWPSDITALRVEDGVASAALPPTADPPRARDLVLRLRAAIAALEDNPGPYR
jgi:hypothetical protein